MSIRSLAVTARRRRAPATAIRPSAPGTWPASAEPASGAGEAGGSDALVSAIPTEVIVLYTTVLGVLTGVLKDNPLATYLPLRWILYGSCIFATGLALAVTYVFTDAPETGETTAERPSDRREATELPPGEARKAAETTPAAAEEPGSGATTKQGWPWGETFMACSSFAVWGLVIPGSPLYVVLHPPTLPVVVAILSAVGTFLSATVFTPWLSHQVEAEPVPPQRPNFQ
ncbi:hypothetical protein ACWCXH_14470 [Kitasatospora sp. NPDC001660]